MGRRYPPGAYRRQGLHDVRPYRRPPGILSALIFQFYSYLQGKTCRVFAAPYDVRLSADPEAAGDDQNDRDVVQPDLVVVCDRRKLRRGGCLGAPDLVLEILSPSNRSHDTLRKFNKYLEAGVREYWIVDPESGAVFVHTLVEPEGAARFYRTGAYGPEAKVAVGILDACVIDLAAVFAAGALAEAGEPGAPSREPPEHEAPGGDDVPPEA